MAVQLPRFLQTKTYSAQRVRAMLSDQGGGIQNGVVNAGDLLVSQKAGGANMSVDVAAGAAWVFGTTIARQGAYNAYNDSVVNLSIAANSSGNPRLDQIILRIYDTIDGGAGSDQATVEVLQGAATAGATLNNRAGAAALPASSILLGDVLVANGAASIVNSSIRDRRAWARGIFHRSWRNSGSYVITNTSSALLDGTFFQPRYECSGAPVRVTLNASVTHGTSGASLDIQIRMDGVQTDGEDVNVVFPNTVTVLPAHHSWVFFPSPGSHLIAPYVSTTSGTAILYAEATRSFGMIVEELVKQNTNNSPSGYG